MVDVPELVQLHGFPEGNRGEPAPGRGGDDRVLRGDEVGRDGGVVGGLRGERVGGFEGEFGGVGGVLRLWSG